MQEERMRWLVRDTCAAVVRVSSAAALGLVLAGPVGAAQNVSLSARAAAQAFYVGQPLVLVVTVKASQPVTTLNVDLSESGGRGPLGVFVDRGQGFVPYRALALASGWGDDARTELERGERTIEYVLSFDANLGDWIFPAPGTYRIVVEYVDGVTRVRSNEVTVSVTEPSAAEAGVMRSLRELGPALMGHHMPAQLSGAIRDLAEQHPKSVYLQELRLLDLEARVGTIGQGYDPDDRRPSTDLSRKPNHSEDAVRTRLATLLPTAQELAEVEGQFQPGALLELGGIYEAMGNEAAARQVFTRIARDFPDRLAAQVARERADVTPPELAIAANPGALWPPNHNLERITVALTVTDDTDPNPTVTLLSIVCADHGSPGLGQQKRQGLPASQGCNAEDIAEAAYGTDDREFRLRSERAGYGPGRTYTITYEAADAAGNKSTATATVTVAHEQGIAKKQ
jgi:hypothetical protein